MYQFWQIHPFHTTIQQFEQNSKRRVTEWRSKWQGKVMIGLGSYQNWTFFAWPLFYFDFSFHICRHHHHSCRHHLHHLYQQGCQLLSAGFQVTAIQHYVEHTLHSKQSKNVKTGDFPAAPQVGSPRTPPSWVKILFPPRRGGKRTLIQLPSRQNVKVLWHQPSVKWTLSNLTMFYDSKQ